MVFEHNAVNRMVTLAKVQVGRSQSTVKSEIVSEIETRSPNTRGRIHTDTGIDSGEEAGGSLTRSGRGSRVMQHSACTDRMAVTVERSDMVAGVEIGICARPPMLR